MQALDLELCVGAIPGTWADGAACIGADPEVYIPAKGHTYERARAICAECPVVSECRSYCDRVEANIRYGRWWGMYGGESPAERFQRRRGRPRR